jgi:hypothetical protein
MEAAGAAQMDLYPYLSQQQKELLHETLQYLELL